MHFPNRDNWSHFLGAKAKYHSATLINMFHTKINQKLKSFHEKKIV